MRGRADIPSAKKSLGSSGSYFGCTAMRWRQVRRQKAEGRRQSRSATFILLPSAFILLPSGFILLPSPRDIRDLPRIERLQKIPHSVEIEFRIARLDDQEEFV